MNTAVSDWLKVVALAGLALNTLTFLVYGWDKFCAVRARARVPESTLHLLALFGGWPGAMLAQRVFRHKSSKRAFRVVFRLTVLGHLLAVAAAFWLASSGR